MPHGRITTRILTWIGHAAVALAILVPGQAWSEPCRSDCESQAVEFVERLANRVSRILENEDNQLPRLKALILESVEFDRIGKYALGRAWNTATEKQRVDYGHLFTQSMLYTVAHQIQNYRGTKIDIVDQYSVGTTDTVVITKITAPSGKQSQMGWRVSATGRGSTIVDVLMSGASMVVTKRHEFAAVVAKRGMDGLITKLRRLVALQSGRNRSSAAVLNFKSMEAGLRRTKAIGFMSKVSMGFEANGLVERAARYRERRSNDQLRALRANFNSLFDRTVAKLKQGGDISFSRALSNSRTALWDQLIHAKQPDAPHEGGSQLALSDYSVE